MYDGILTSDLSRLTLKVYILSYWSAVGWLVVLQCTVTELKVQVGPRGNKGLGHRINISWMLHRRGVGLTMTEWPS